MSAPQKLKVGVVGLGPIGISAAVAVSADAGMELAALVDLDPAKIGKTLGQLGTSMVGGPTVTATTPDTRLDVVILCTTSRFDAIAPTLQTFIDRKTHVVSSCEEMAFPSYANPGLAKDIHAKAQAAGVGLVGTGVNPGFVMDLLAVVLSSMVAKVTAVKCLRRVDASTRRKPLQAKIGSTMTPAHFAELKRQGTIGHKGLPESIALIAAGLGRTATPGSIAVTLDPVIADREIPSSVGLIQPGQVCGMHNTGHWSADGLTIDLDLTMAMNLPDPHDAIELSGPVPLKLIIPGSTPGDSATVASLVNVARLLPRAKPGLLTMLDLPAAGAR